MRELDIATARYKTKKPVKGIFLSLTILIIGISGCLMLVKYRYCVGIKHGLYPHYLCKIGKQYRYDKLLIIRATILVTKDIINCDA